MFLYLMIFDKYNMLIITYEYSPDDTTNDNNSDYDEIFDLESFGVFYGDHIKVIVEDLLISELGNEYNVDIQDDGHIIIEDENNIKTEFNIYYIFENGDFSIDFNERHIIQKMIYNDTYYILLDSANFNNPNMSLYIDHNGLFFYDGKIIDEDLEFYTNEDLKIVNIASHINITGIEYAQEFYESNSAFSVVNDDDGYYQPLSNDRFNNLTLLSFIRPLSIDYNLEFYYDGFQIDDWIHLTNDENITVYLKDKLDNLVFSFDVTVDSANVSNLSSNTFIIDELSLHNTNGITFDGLLISDIDRSSAFYYMYHDKLRFGKR